MKLFKFKVLQNLYGVIFWSFSKIERRVKFYNYLILINKTFF